MLRGDPAHSMTSLDQERVDLADLELTEREWAIVVLQEPKELGN